VERGAGWSTPRSESPDGRQRAARQPWAALSCSAAHRLRVSREGAFMASQSEIAAMGRAVELAARGLGTTSPNPVVGCVILDADGAVVGEGFHAYAGGPHAEIVALAQAGERARGGTAVVTLEPCNHHGQTGPCSTALINAGVARVVIGVSEPQPHAAGGAETLRKAGVDVEIGVRQAEVEAGNIAWL